MAKHTLPELPYAKDALEPVISKETIEYHYGKHHQAYVNKTNAAIEGTPLAELSLEELIKKTHGSTNDRKVFNSAAQIWNHTFYWNCMSPNGGGEPSGKAAEAIKKSFGDFNKFKEEFNNQAAAIFGSGWAWVVKDGDGISIVQTKDAENPMVEGKSCLLTVDMWEHAFYIDYRNAKAKYLEEFWKVVNWDHFNKQFG